MRREFCLFKRADKKVYYYSTYINEKRVFKSTGCKSKADALSYCLRLLSNGALHTQIKEGVRFKNFANGFFDKDSIYLKQQEETKKPLTESTRRSYVGILNDRLLPIFGDFTLKEINPATIRNWLLQIKEVTPQVKNRYLMVLSIILREACFRDLISSNPCDNVKRFAYKKNEKVVFTSEEIKKLFESEWQDKKVELMCKISCLTGLRSGEVRALTLEKIFKYYILVDSSIEERINKLKSTKSGKARTVPITEKLYNEIVEYANERKGFIFKGCYGNKNGSITGATLLRVLKTQLKKVGIYKEGLTFHSFRHYFNSQLVLGNIKSEIIRKVVGHENEEMTEHYLHINQNELNNIREIQKKILC